jgi:hypothetical protein
MSNSADHTDLLSEVLELQDKVNEIEKMLKRMKRTLDDVEVTVKRIYQNL